jgi:hypothetical protein
MEHLKERRKIFNRLWYLLLIFLIVAMLAIAAFYNGVLFKINLNPFAYVFVGIEAVIIVYIYKMVMDEEKLENAKSQ